MLPLPSLSGRSGRPQDASLRRLCSLHAVDLHTVAPVSTPPPESLRVLLVEQDEPMRDMLLRTLSSLYLVETAADGPAAGAAAKSHPPDLVIIDLYVPGTDSLPLIRSLRADRQTTLLPIIVLTASINRESLLHCLNAGASNFLLKPFRMAELLTCIKLELALRGPHAACAERVM